MTKYDSSAIRNLAFVGHGNCGKTTLSEALLQEAGLIARVPAGVIDCAPDEKERGHSIDLGVVRFSWNENIITVLDAPGYQDFFQNAVAALSVAESAVIVVSATDGITVNTRRVWQLARELNLPTMIVLTKLDGENIELEELIGKIQTQFGKHCIPVNIPDGVGKQFSQITDVLGNDEIEYHEQLKETTVETDEELLERYFEDDNIDLDTIKKQMKIAIRTEKLVPIVSVVLHKELVSKNLSHLW